jgi:hypothetical protein
MQLELHTLRLHLLLLLLLTLLSPILATSAPPTDQSSPQTDPNRAGLAAVTVTAQYTIGSFGLGLTSCRMLLNRMQNPFPTPICIAVGVGVGALTPGGHARMTYDDVVWAWIDNHVGEIWSGTRGMGVGGQEPEESLLGAGQ